VCAPTGRGIKEKIVFVSPPPQKQFSYPWRRFAATTKTIFVLSRVYHLVVRRLITVGKIGQGREKAKKFPKRELFQHSP
jgi:hypothetical protein